MIDSDLKICTKKTSHPTVPLEELVDKILLLAEILAEKKQYPYQKEFSYRIVEALLLHSGDTITGLFSRQCGKTMAIAQIAAACSLILPVLANSPVFADDWRFNITDEQGNYRGYKNGIKIGIYAPIQNQADIAFSRMKEVLNTNTAKQVAKELGVKIEISNGNEVLFSNGSYVTAQSASEKSNVEGATFQWLTIDEAQDVDEMKINKSLTPMVSSFNGIVVETGTCSPHKCAFYTTIKTNNRLHALGGPKNHYEYNYEVCQEYNSMYKEFVEKQKIILGEESDAFRLAFKLEWLLERGQFITEEQLRSPRLAMITGPFSKFWTGSPKHSFEVAGIDLGKVNDPTVVCVCNVDWNNPLADQYVQTPEGEFHFIAYMKHIVGFLSILGDNYEDQFSQIVDYLSNFKGLRKIGIDATGVGQWGLDRFTVHYSQFDRGKTLSGNSDYGFVEVQGMNFNIQSKSDGYKLLHSDLMSGRLTYPAGDEARKTRNFVKFVTEMCDLKKTYKNGYMQCAAPDSPGAHDDVPSAVMIACVTAQTPADSGQIEIGLNEFLRN